LIVVTNRKVYIIFFLNIFTMNDVYSRRAEWKRLEEAGELAEPIPVNNAFARRKMQMNESQKRTQEEVFESWLYKPFEEYDDPKGALKVWCEYHGDFNRLGLYEFAENIKDSCSTSVGLDIALSKLVAQGERRLFGKKHFPLVDPDSNGCWANMVRAVEESR
jgi:hypothetical protein